MSNELVNLSKKQFDEYCALIYRVCGINLNEEKRSLLNARISKRLRLTNSTPNQYLETIQRDSKELTFFIDAVTTNHTYFFRESKSFRYIGAQCKDIWCAACSTGEEPYSLAAHCVALEAAPRILATDISETCLQKARQGVYPNQCVDKIPSGLLKMCFQKGKNKWSDMVRVKPRLRDMVSFQKFNLLQDSLPQTMFDAVFCRNVMIYFDVQTKNKVVSRLSSTLKPGGYFIIGGAESLSGLEHKLRYLEPSVYQKP